MVELVLTDPQEWKEVDIIALIVGKIMLKLISLEMEYNYILLLFRAAFQLYIFSLNNKSFS